MFGLGLVHSACGMILRYSGKYLAKHRASFTPEQADAIDALITAALAFQAAIAPFFAVQD